MSNTALPWGCAQASPCTPLVGSGRAVARRLLPRREPWRGPRHAARRHPCAYPNPTLQPDPSLAAQVLPAREGGEFRGSTTYASVHSHLKQDLGARP